jgi:DNA-nicking Smr family endonuclease|tara:strand:+ start:84 stop:503 length:420 start_codon:yes stop_codon:yes gene_type:complete
VKNKKDTTELDKKNWDEYIKNPKDIFDKDLNSNSNYSKSKIYRFDLHGYTLLEANIKVKEIILFCLEKNYTEILLITGKGIHSNTKNNIYVSNNLSKLRYSIPEYIKSEDDLFNKIISIKSAEKKDGGDGALIIKFKKL